MRRIFLLALAAVPAIAWAADTLTVVVKEAALKKQPQFYAPSVGTVKLGEKASATAVQGAWHQVTVGGKSGWLHASALTAKKVNVTGGTTGASGTSASEVTLAGKGFNSQVEGSYKKKHPGSNFEAVDRMEKTQVSDDEVVRFLAEGGLGGSK